MVDPYPKIGQAIRESPFTDDSKVWKNNSYYRQNIIKWSMYDLGNTIYSMVVVSLTIGPLLYIKYYEQGLPGDVAVSRGNFALSMTLLVGNLLMAFFSPFVGAVADKVRERKRLLMKFTWLCVTFMALLGVSYWIDDVFVLIVFFLLANLTYQIGLVIYDSILPFIADEDDLGRVSAFGISIGYFGSFIGIGLGFILIAAGLPDYVVQTADPARGILDMFEIGYIPFIYPIAAVIFLLFAIPMYTVREKKLKNHKVDIENIVKETIQEVVSTAKDVAKYRSMKWFILGWLIYVDAANTTISFMSQIVTVGLEFSESRFVLIVLGLGILYAVLFTYPVGVVTDRYGPRKALILVTMLWFISIVLAFFTNITPRSGEELGIAFKTPDWLLYVFPLFVGPALGGTWVVQRQYLTELAPPEKIGNYFGFANIFGRISAAFGPIIFTTTIDLLWQGGNLFSINVATRLGLLILGGLLLIGFLILVFKVEDVHDHFLAGAKANGKGQWVIGDEIVHDELEQSFLEPTKDKNSEKLP